MRKHTHLDSLCEYVNVSCQATLCPNLCGVFFYRLSETTESAFINVRYDVNTHRKYKDLRNGTNIKLERSEMIKYLYNCAIVSTSYC